MHTGSSITADDAVIHCTRSWPNGHLYWRKLEFQPFSHAEQECVCSQSNLKLATLAYLLHTRVLNYLVVDGVWTAWKLILVLGILSTFLGLVIMSLQAYWVLMQD